MGCLKSLTGNLLSDHSTLSNAVHPLIHRNRMRAGHKEVEVKGRSDKQQLGFAGAGLDGQCVARGFPHSKTPFEN